METDKSKRTSIFEVGGPGPDPMLAPAVNLLEEVQRLVDSLRKWPRPSRVVKGEAITNIERRAFKLRAISNSSAAAEPQIIPIRNAETDNTSKNAGLHVNGENSNVAAGG